MSSFAYSRKPEMAHLYSAMFKHLQCLTSVKLHSSGRTELHKKIKVPLIAIRTYRMNFVVEI